MNGKSCFFMGHREADARFLPRLELEIDRLIREENVRYFYVGGYGEIKNCRTAYPENELRTIPGWI